MESCQLGHLELRELGGVVPYLAGSLEPVEPPRHLKSAVLAAIQADIDARRPAEPVRAPVVALPVATAKSEDVATSSPSAVSDASAGRVVSLAGSRGRRARTALTWMTRAAAALVIVGLTGYVFAVQSDLDKAKTQQDHANKILNAFQVFGSRSALLTPEHGQKGGGEAVMLPSGHIILSLQGLTPTTGDGVYMVWLSADGGPIANAGWFTVDSQGTGYLEIASVPPSDSLWLLVSREANKNAARPGSPVVTGTIWVYSAPAPTPTIK
jgi:hypothetical protein